MSTQRVLDVEEAMALAIERHRAGALQDARVLYEKVLAVVPEHAGAHTSLAMIHQATGDLDSARARMDLALEHLPNHAGFWLNSGAIDRARGDDAAAVAAHERAIELDPDLAAASYNLCALHLAANRAQEAVAVCTRRLAHAPRDSRALAFKAHALEAAGDLASADALLDHKHFVRHYRLKPPKGHPNLESFNKALGAHIQRHPTLERDASGRTRNGYRTGELLKGRLGPMAAFKRQIEKAIRQYRKELPIEPQHPFTAAAPRRHRISSWALLLQSGGHEAAHMHPQGWLTGIYYVQLPAGMGAEDESQAGWLEFGRPGADLHVPSAPRIRRVAPREGRLYLFPSYFYHGTLPFPHSRPQISISFDVQPDEA
ncbi:MAG: hypothetical protein EA417_21195 [Gammaproteobacteria bacterium]|nr:MAG: hypothetical protein EA417_21195 [Gammaproteobacteria bacterium]